MPRMTLGDSAHAVTAIALFACTICEARAGLDKSPFYVIDIRASGDAVLHLSSTRSSSTSELPYVIVDAPRMSCCFRFGARQPGRKSPIQIDMDAPPLTSDDGEESTQHIGYSTQSTGESKLAFGIEGMTAASAVGKRSYQIRREKSEKPIIVRHCLGAEGVNFRLYHTLGDKQPYASFYYALGYDVKADCR